MPLPRKYDLFFGLNLTDEQREVADMMYDKEIVFIDALSGGGKTTLAVALSKILHEEDPEVKMEYIFAPINEKAMGYRAGNQTAKNSAYTTPLYDALAVIKENPRLAVYDEDERLKDLVDRYWIYPQAVTFLRGSNKIKKINIIDEAQNYTFWELKKALSRHGFGSKTFVIGNMEQCDLKNPKESAFKHFMDWYATDQRTGIGKLTHNFRGWVSEMADKCPPPSS